MIDMIEVLTEDYINKKRGVMLLSPASNLKPPTAFEA